MSRTDGEARPGVLFVCTGNICRSPAAELLFRARVGSGAGLEVHSAGLRAQVGRPLAPPMAALLQARGVDPAGSRGRQFLPSLVSSATVVLTMTVEQRTAVVTRVPAAVRRTFTLREFAALAALVAPVGGRRPAERLAELVAGAPRVRKLRVAGADDDIDDPFGRLDEAYARAFGLIAATVDDVAAFVGRGDEETAGRMTRAAAFG